MFYDKKTVKEIFGLYIFALSHQKEPKCPSLTEQNTFITITDDIRLFGNLISKKLTDRLIN